jgi:hypothetical protein
VGILDDQLLGPVVLPNRLSGAVYHHFLVNDLAVLLELVPLHQRHVVHTYGELSHILHIVRQHLNQTFSEQWIGHRGSVILPSRSSELNPLDFWLWKHLKTLVYLAPMSDLEVLQQ